MADQEEDFSNPFAIDDYLDAMALAHQWEMYWGASKRLMHKGNRWYFKEIPIATPRKVQTHVPSTARSLVNDAADHLTGSRPEFEVRMLRESQRADDDRQRVAECLNSGFDLLATNEGGHPLHRSLAIHGGWSGMMVARIGVREGWDPDKPVIEDIYWKAVDPRYVYPDPGTGGKKAVVIKKRADVGSIRQMWPDWQGHWFPPSSWDSSYVISTNGRFTDTRDRLDRPLSDNAIVEWIEYWDEKYKCFIANGVPIFRTEVGEDLVEHGLGFVPFVIRAAGYGDSEGEPHQRFFSMLAGVFSELETEARLITQLKWIVENHAFPMILAPKDTEGQLDMTPGMVSHIDNPESIKEIKALREDTQEPKAILSFLTHIQDQIEKATYPQVLKGRAPNGMTSGYPIAILAGQAKLKFAAQNDALKGVFQELGMKTLLVVQNRFKTNCEVIKGFRIKPTDADSYYGRLSVTLEPTLPVDQAAKLQLLEFLLGSTGFSKVDAITELGFKHAEQIRQRRMAEDIEDDPRVRQVMSDQLIPLLSPEAAAAAQQVAEPNMEMQKLGQTVQELQGRIAVITEMLSLRNAESQLQGGQEPAMGGASTGAPTPPLRPPTPPPPGGGAQPPLVSSSPGGSPLFGQAPLNPNGNRQLEATINPMVEPAQAARNVRAFKTLTEDTSLAQQFGRPNGGM